MIPKEIVVGVLTLIGGIIAAIFAWIQAVRTARLATSTQLAIESQKLAAAKRQLALETAKQDCAPIEQSLEQAWRDIQTIKDSLVIVLSTHAYDKAATYNRLRAATTNVASEYAASGSRLSEGARVGLHRAKTTALEIQLILEDLASDNFKLTDHLLQQIANARISLGEFQMLIAAERAELRNVAIDRLLANL